MGPAVRETNRQLIFAFCQEFFGSLFLYILFYPTGAILGNSVEGWVFHFLAVIGFDILTAGACANPMICLALFFAGKLTFIGTAVRVCAEVLVAFTGFSILHSVVPERLIDLTGGPELAAGIDVYYGCIVEGLISFLFALTVLLASSFVTDPDFARPLFATVLRLLIEGSAPITGANMNSMIGFSWAFYTNRTFSQDYQMVYSVSPLIGGVIAAGAYYLVMTIIFPNYEDGILAVTMAEEKEASKMVMKNEGDMLNIKGRLESPIKAPKTPTKSKKTPTKTEARSVTRSQTKGPNLRKKSTK